MPLEYCPTCSEPHHWEWEEAFNKFGFGDGDGMVMTQTVADTLREAGYQCETQHWGLHNVVIISIKKDERELILHDDINLGYDDPRNYLPKDIVILLDTELAD